MHFVKETLIAASVEDVFAFHERPDAFALLEAPWEHSEILQSPSSIAGGTQVKLRTRVGPIWVTIEAEHVGYEKKSQLRRCDEQRSVHQVAARSSVTR